MLFPGPGLKEEEQTWAWPRSPGEVHRPWLAGLLSVPAESWQDLPSLARNRLSSGRVLPLPTMSQQGRTKGRNGNRQVWLGIKDTRRRENVA